MALFTMTAASFLSAPGPGQVPCSSTPAAQRRLIAAAKSAETTTADSCSDKNQESNNGTRDLMFVAAAAAMRSVAGLALADEPKPKRGTPQAKKAYSPVCVTMPTARICHN